LDIKSHEANISVDRCSDEFFLKHVLCLANMSQSFCIQKTPHWQTRSGQLVIRVNYWTSRCNQ